MIKAELEKEEEAQFQIAAGTAAGSSFGSRRSSMCSSASLFRAPSASGMASGQVQTPAGATPRLLSRRSSKTATTDMGASYSRLE